ncbi:repressor LexA, partial [Streptomyces sp900116325]
HTEPQRGSGMRRDGVLSPRQESILRVIRSSIFECGEGPTVRQIGERVGLSSTSSVAYQLGRLEALGLISRSGRRWRSCRLGA